LTITSDPKTEQSDRTPVAVNLVPADLSIQTPSPSKPVYGQCPDCRRFGQDQEPWPDSESSGGTPQVSRRSNRTKPPFRQGDCEGYSSFCVARRFVPEDGKHRVEFGVSHHPCYQMMKPQLGCPVQTNLPPLRSGDLFEECPTGRHHRSLVPSGLSLRQCRPYLSPVQRTLGGKTAEERESVFVAS
jgi:hypothetical protein